MNIKIDELASKCWSNPIHKIGEFDQTKFADLSDDEWEDRYNNCEYIICYMDYRAGFRDVEKAHGITGVEFLAWAELPKYSTQQQ